MTDEFIQEAESRGLVYRGSAREEKCVFYLTVEGKQWMSDILAKEQGQRYDQAARVFNADIWSKTKSTVEWETATWDDRCEDGWNADHLRVIGTRTLNGHEVKVTNWISIKRIYAEKIAGIDTALIYAGQFEQRVREEVGC